MSLSDEKNLALANMNGEVEMGDYDLPSPDGAESTKSKGRTAGNTYAAKKTVAQGMMDIALITANANQLRYLIEFQQKNISFYIILTLLIISLFLQIGVGLLLIFKGRLDLKGEDRLIQANIINNWVVVSVFLITVINVFIASFSISPSTPNIGGS